MKNLKTPEWNKSYIRGENFIWYPHEEVIRFISKYIKKKTDIYRFSSNKIIKGLDFGCGIGRHLIYLDDMQIEGYGIDISGIAIEKALEWIKYLKRYHLLNRLTLTTGDLPLPYSTNFFDFILSHGVFDSMFFNIAKDNLLDISRILKPLGFFYLDVISKDEINEREELLDEEIVQTLHEKGTVQSYFNFSKVNKLIENSSFEIVEALLIKRENIKSNNYSARYHLILQNNK